MEACDFDVLIVGAGPTGLLAALLLEQQGVSTQIVERRPHPQRAPAAHVVNARTLEICRAAGVDMEAAMRAAKTPEDAGYAYWVTKLGGRMIGRARFERQGDDQLDVTPTPLRNLSQNRFEPLLLEALERKSGGVPAWSHTLVRCEDRGDHVVTSVRHDDSGRTREITSRYLIGADGAGSPVRKSLGIELEGPARLQSFIMVHMRARLRGVPHVPPGVLFFVSDPETGGVAFIVHDLDREAVCMMPFDPEQESPDDYDEARCEARIRRALEDPSLAFEIANIGAWTMTAQVAEAYGRGRIFLAGDSAHRFPPTGGLGLNSGAQDAHNLAWKLAFVLGGRASPALLDTYEQERRPVARENADQSLRNALKMIEVAVALDLGDPAQATGASLEAKLDDPEVQKRLEVALANQQEHFDMPGLQLGFGYTEGALVRGEGDDLPPTAVRAFTPSGAPGARLPHAWLRPRDRGESLLDRIPLDRFTLLAGPDGQAWLDAAARLGEHGIEVVRVDEAGLEDFARWLKQAGIERDGALLVRPDQHVAYRSCGGVASPADELASVLRRVAG